MHVEDLNTLFPVGAGCGTRHTCFWVGWPEEASHGGTAPHSLSNAVSVEKIYAVGISWTVGFRFTICVRPALVLCFVNCATLHALGAYFGAPMVVPGASTSASSDTKPTSSKGVPLPELLTQLRHYNAQSRAAALQVLEPMPHAFLHSTCIKP